MNLVDALLAEMTRVRDEVMPHYIEIGRPGAFALIMMRKDLDAAARALAYHDIGEGVRLLESLKGYTT
jgi:hypothetical protein